MKDLISEIDDFINHKKYEIDFGFWGRGNNHVVVKKHDVQLLSITECETMEQCMEEILFFLYRANKIPKIKRIPLNNLKAA